MDDILKNEKKMLIEERLNNINKLHENLKFTLEREENQELPVLDMKIMHDYKTGQLSSTWYNKPTDTGLIMNYHALAPKRYKRSVVSGFVHRIYRACSSWQNFHLSIEKAKRVLEKNQYPPTFYEPIIRQALYNILNSDLENQPPLQTNVQNQIEKKNIFVQYRGKSTDEYARALHKIKAPCIIVMTLRKLKTVLPSLKPQVDKLMRSGVIYKLTCPRCSACYVGQTGRHMLTRFKEHLQRAGPMKTHLNQCKTDLTEEKVEILQSTARGEGYLLTLEALYIRELKPTINTKDEYRTREFIIKL